MKSLPLSQRWGALQAWRHLLKVPQFTVVTGVIVIALGTLLMASPLCSQPSVELWDALFTVTSAITVTGLSVVDVGQELTLLGQRLLLALLITGGLGLMAITTFPQGFVQGHADPRTRVDKGRTLDEIGGGGIGPAFNGILMGATRSTLQSRQEVVIHQRQIPSTVVLRAIGVSIASLLFVLLMALLLGIGPTCSGTSGRVGFGFLEKLFTCMSAFGTEGLDLGVTAQLNRWGQLVLRVGRLGILLLLSAVYGSRPQPRVGYPREELYI